MQLEQAARAEQAPADVSMMSQVPLLKGQATELWAPLDLAKMPNSTNLLPRVRQQVSRRAGRRRRGGDLVHHAGHQHRASIREAPTSWAALWDPANKDKLGLLALVVELVPARDHRQDLLRRHRQLLDTDEGILKVMDKLAELKPNVRLWYRDEAQFEQALKSGEIPMGQYYHDVTGLAASRGPPGALDLPQGGRGQRQRLLGGIARLAEARRGACLHRLHVPAGDPGAAVAQGRHVADGQARGRSTSPTEEFAAVSSDIPPIIPRYDLYTAKADWLNQKWTELIVG